MSGRFTFDEEGFYSNDKTFIIPLGNLYLLALLNSRLTWFYLESICAGHGDRNEGGRLELRSIYMEQIPIHRINFTTPTAERATALAKACALYQTYLQDGDRAPILTFVAGCLARQPEASDIVHDLLAFLAEEMLRLNREKRALQQEFLSWLEQKLRIQPMPDKDGRTGIDALSGKTDLQNYPGDYQKNEEPLTTTRLRQILLDNRRRLLVYLNDALLNEVEAVYLPNVERVKVLKEGLRLTDRLIDYVVYGLYGLSEDEIGVVEG